MRIRGARGGARAGAASLAAPRPRTAQIPGLPPIADPRRPPPPAGTPEFTGSAPPFPSPVGAPQVPRHPFMAPNGLSNIHNDAYQTDTYAWAARSARDVQSDSTLFFRECGSVTVDSEGRLETICVGLDHPVLALLDPVTLEVAGDLRPAAAQRQRATRSATSPAAATSTSTTTTAPSRRRRPATSSSSPRPRARVRARSRLRPQRRRCAGRRDHLGASRLGRADLVRIDEGRRRLGRSGDSGQVHVAQPRRGDHELVRGRRRRRRLHRHRRGAVPLRRSQRRRRRRRGGSAYDNNGVAKPGQSDAGSGTTPTIMGRNYVAITDNADPMQIVVVRRQAVPLGRPAQAQAPPRRAAGSSASSRVREGRRRRPTSR